MKIRYVIFASIPLLLVILGVMYPISGFNDLPSTLVAWGTLMLAIATFTLIQRSREQEEQRRKDDISRERRQREENLLNEISEWLTANANFRMHFTTWEKDRFLAESLNMIQSLQNLYVKGISLTRIIRTERPNLVQNMNKVIDVINEIISTLLRDDITPKERNAIVLLLRNKLIESTGEAYEIVDALKVKLLNP